MREQARDKGRLQDMIEAASGIELETLDVDHSLSKPPVPATIHP